MRHVFQTHTEAVAVRREDAIVMAILNGNLFLSGVFVTWKLPKNNVF